MAHESRDVLSAQRACAPLVLRGRSSSASAPCRHHACSHVTMFACVYGFSLLPRVSAVSTPCMFALCRTGASGCYFEYHQTASRVPRQRALTPVRANVRPGAFGGRLGVARACACVWSAEANLERSPARLVLGSHAGAPARCGVSQLLCRIVAAHAL